MCAASALVTEDFYKKWRPKEDSKKYLKVTRITTVVLAVLGTCWALLVPTIGGALDAILNVVAITDMPIFVMVVLGVFTKKINATGALSGLLTGTIAGAVVSFAGVGGIQGLAVTTATSTGISLIVAVLVSYAVRRGNAEESRLERFFARISEPEAE